MKILYCGYRQWSLICLNRLELQYPEHEFILVKDQSEFNLAKEKQYDITLLVGWSWIIDNDFLNRNLTVVFHPSDLPSYSGGSPIQNQIIDGLEETYATLFKATSQLDQGPIISKGKLSLRGSLQMVFSSLTACSFMLIKNLIDTFPNYTETPQKGNIIKCKRRTPDMSEITLKEICNSTAKELYNKVRCLQYPYPIPFIQTKSGRLYITGARYEEDDNISTR